MQWSGGAFAQCWIRIGQPLGLVRAGSPDRARANAWIMKLMRWPYHPSCAQLCIVQQTFFWPFSLMITNFPSLLYLFTECITDSCSIPLSAWDFSSSPWCFPCSKCSWLIHVYLAKPAFLSLPVSAEWWSVDDLFWISNWRLKLDTSAVGSSWEKVFVVDFPWPSCDFGQTHFFVEIFILFFRPKRSRCKRFY